MINAGAPGRARIGLNPVQAITDEVATFAHQLGVPRIVRWPTRWLEAPGEPACWTVEALTAAKRQCDERGLVLEAIGAHNYIRAMLGLPGADRQIDQCITTIRRMGAVGVRVLDYFWAPNGAWRTSFTDELRPGAMTNSFDLALVEAAGAVLRKDGTNCVMIVSRQIQEIIKVGAGISRPLDDGGILDLRHTWGEENIERRNPVPKQPGRLAHGGLTLVPYDRRHDPDNGTLDTCKGKQR